MEISLSIIENILQLLITAIGNENLHFSVYFEIDLGDLSLNWQNNGQSTTALEERFRQKIPEICRKWIALF